MKIYLTALVIFLAIDLFWLTLVARKFYATQLDFLLSQDPNLWAALLFYLLFVVGLVIFVIQPALATQSFSQALLMGALFGLISYATYDLTNLATIKDWPLLVTAVDLVWGAVLSASVSGLSFWVITKLQLA